MICKHHVFGCAGKELPKAQLGAKKRSSVSRTKLPRAKRSRSEGTNILIMHVFFRVVDLESLYHV